MPTSLFPRFADNIDGARCIGGQNQRMRLRTFEQLLALLDAGGALCLRVEIEIERTARLFLRVRTLTRHHRLDSDDGLLAQRSCAPSRRPLSAFRTDSRGNRELAKPAWQPPFMNACSLHALYMIESAAAKKAFFPGNDPPRTKKAKTLTSASPYPTCFFIMG